MNYVILLLNICSVLGFATAFYYSMRLYNQNHLTSIIPTIRAIAILSGLMWCIFLTFSTISGVETFLITASNLLSLMIGLFVVLAIAKSY